mgnify:CR=1 FL=1
MAFRLVKAPVFWWPVVVRTPAADRPGAVEEHRFEMEFEAIGQDEARRLRDEVAAISDPAGRERREHALLERVCRNWREVTDEDGKSVPFSADAFAAALQITWVRAAIYAADAEAMNGEARLGN